MFLLAGESFESAHMNKSPSDEACGKHPEGAGDSPMELAKGDLEAIRHLKDAVRSGTDWHKALLEAMGMWTVPEEELRGRLYRYMVSGEAFDWLLLAERLCGELDGIVPAEEKERLLFRGRLPDEISDQDFREILGLTKHRAFLNYWYGVVVEEALQLAVEEEVRKQHRAKGFSDSEDLVEEAFLRIYEGTRTDLLHEFLKDTGHSSRQPISLTELKEFTYWLFGRRLKMWDPARVASDTRKGLQKLDSLRGPDG